MSSQILTDSILQDSTTAGACPKPMLSTLHKKIRPFRGSWLQKTWCLRFRFQESGKCLWLYKMNHFFPHKKRAKTLGIRSFPSKKKTTSSKVPGTVFLSKSVAMLGTSHEPRDGSHKITAAPKAIGYGWIKTHHWNVEYPTDPKGEWENDNRKHGISVQTG